jgi:hypothetical protein
VAAAGTAQELFQRLQRAVVFGACVVITFLVGIYVLKGNVRPPIHPSPCPPHTSARDTQYARTKQPSARLRWSHLRWSHQATTVGSPASLGRREQTLSFVETGTRVQGTGYNKAYQTNLQAYPPLAPLPPEPVSPPPMYPSPPPRGGGFNLQEEIDEKQLLGSMHAFEAIHDHSAQVVIALPPTRFRTSCPEERAYGLAGDAVILPRRLASLHDRSLIG